MIMIVTYSIIGVFMNVWLDSIKKSAICLNAVKFKFLLLNDFVNFLLMPFFNNFTLVVKTSFFAMCSVKRNCFECAAATFKQKIS